MITLYTAITGGKDKPVEQNWPIIRFIDSYDKFKDNRRNSRIQKIMPHKYFDSEFTIWIDGNMKLLISPEELIKRYMDGYDMMIFKHTTRNCIYDEVLQCCKLKLDNTEILIEQAKYYEDHGYPKNKGLCEGGFIIRRNNERTRAFNEAWWADYCRFSRRDQISLMPAMDKIGLAVNVIYEPWVVDTPTIAHRGDIVQIQSHDNFEGNFNSPENMKKLS